MKITGIKCYEIPYHSPRERGITIFLNGDDETILINLDKKKVAFNLTSYRSMSEEELFVAEKIYNQMFLNWEYKEGYDVSDVAMYINSKT